MDGLEAHITHIALASQKDNVLRVLYKVDITKDGEKVATGETVSADKWSILGWKKDLEEQGGPFPKA